MFYSINCLKSIMTLAICNIFRFVRVFCFFFVFVSRIYRLLIRAYAKSRPNQLCVHSIIYSFNYQIFLVSFFFNVVLFLFSVYTSFFIFSYVPERFVTIKIHKMQLTIILITFPLFFLF